MRKQDALEILEAKLAAIEEDHESELAGHKEPRKPIDAKAEARALSAVFDFLESCRVEPTESLLRVFRRYLRPTRTHTPITEQRRSPKARAS
jgi:hypothetical protein